MFGSGFQYGKAFAWFVVVEYSYFVVPAITRAEISDRQKSILISNISHDIRTPLTGMLGYANLASKCITNEERTLDYLEKITDIGKEMDFLINSILDMNLIEADCNTAINGYIKKTYELYEIKRVLYRNVR